MRGIFLALCLALTAAAANADTTVCTGGRCGLIRHQRVVVQSDAPTSVTVVGGARGVTVVSAQEHADQLAATNTFVHCGRRGGGYEGLGFSTASPRSACENACFWGQRRVREIGTAWCPARHGWIAVVRYE